MFRASHEMNPPSQRSPSPGSWQAQRERGAPILLRLLIGFARLAGRRFTRLLLFPIVLYFLFAGGQARDASSAYLRRVLGRAPSWRDRARHLHCFASCTLDRVFLLGGRHHIEIVQRRREDSRCVEEAGRGCIAIGSHLGSFEALRTPQARYPQAPLRILMDRQHNATATQLLEALDPAILERVIDAGQRGPQLVLALREALATGDTIGIMGDRVIDGERSVEVDFLGGKARMPLSPWILAGVLNVPVIIGFGLYRGGARYEIYHELFAERVELPRAGRDLALQEIAQRYAQRLEHHVRLAPYNWFNWYRYWS